MTGVSVVDCVSGLAGATASMTTGVATATPITILIAAIRPRTDTYQHVLQEKQAPLYSGLVFVFDPFDEVRVSNI
jgi:hypothetical protein